MVKVPSSSILRFLIILVAVLMIIMSVIYLAKIDDGFDNAYDEIDEKLQERAMAFIEIREYGVSQDEAIDFIIGKTYRIDRITRLENVYKDYEVEMTEQDFKQIVNQEIYIKKKYDRILIFSRRSSSLCFINYQDELYVLSVDIYKDPLYLINSVWNITKYYITLALGLILLIFALSLIYRPIEKISAGLDKLAKGDYNVEIKDSKARTTHIQRAHNNFNKLVRELRNKSDFTMNILSVISHELKTPITTIKGYSKLLQDENISTEDKTAYLDIIDSECSRLSKLSTNMLFITSLKDKELIQREAFQLDELIRHMIVLKNSIYTKKNIKLDIDMEEVVCYSNEEMLSHVIINLLDNAIKFTPEGGNISIICREIDYDIIIKIRDNGCGISQEHIDKVFEPFYYVEETKSKDSSGLGLAIVKRITTLLGGSIDIQSELNKGTEITINLPRFIIYK